MSSSQKQTPFFDIRLEGPKYKDQEAEGNSKQLNGHSNEYAASGSWSGQKARGNSVQWNGSASSEAFLRYLQSPLRQQEQEDLPESRADQSNK